MKIIQLIFFFLFVLISSGKPQLIIPKNVLYIGVDNLVSVAGMDINSADVVLKCDAGPTKKLSKTKFTVKICSTSLRSTVINVLKKGKLIEKKEVRVEPIPDPTLSTCTQDGEIIFKGCQGIRAEIKDFFKEGIVCTVNKFRITILKFSGEALTIENIGSYYNAAAQNAFSSLKVGDTITLSGFEVTVGCEKESRKLNTVLKSVYTGKKNEGRI